MKILIVEDQVYPLEALEQAVQKVVPKYFPGFTAGDYDIAKWYTQAEEMIWKDQYGLILLDHRMPYEDPKCDELEDFEGFSSKIKDGGYLLIELIKKRSSSTIIIGTSSLHQQELGQYSAPDYQLRSKFPEEAERGLEEIIKLIHQ